MQDDQTLRLKGQGGPAPSAGAAGGGTPGDAYVEIRVRPHRLFERKGQDIHVELPVTLGEAVLGAKVTVPTVTGPVAMTVPKGANTGTTLRLKEKGVLNAKSGRRGDQYVRLKVVLPDKPDAELEKLVGEWASNHPYDVRSKLES
jgi:DnaJ-class molecular chaperone